LHLNYTQITDTGVKHLISLGDLTYLNLVGTSISDDGLAYLSEMPKLKDIFVYRTKITAEGVQQFSKKSEGTRVDTGGYMLPKLASDTIVFKRSI
jgi:hypothetical protein